MCDLFDDKTFEEKLRRLATGFQKRFGDLLKYNVDEEIEKYKVGRMREHSRKWLTCNRTSERRSRHTSSTKFRYSLPQRSKRQRSWSKAQTP
jgi:hypothetical protein